MTAPPQPAALSEVAALAARRGGAILRQLYGNRELEIEQKSKNDFVSAADHASEAAIIATLRDAYPRHAILAEEQGHVAAEGGEAASVQWIVDPLDGTTNFLQGVPYFCVSIACRVEGELTAAAIFDPLHDDLFVAARGLGAQRNGTAISVSAHPGLDGAFLATGFPFKARQALDCYLELFGAVFRRCRAIRRCGAAALDLAYTAAGVYDGFFEFSLAPWDIAAGALLIREAGGMVSDLDGGAAFLDSGNILAGGGGVFAELRAVVAEHVDEATMARLVPAD